MSGTKIPAGPEKSAGPLKPGAPLKSGLKVPPQGRESTGKSDFNPSNTHSKSIFPEKAVTPGGKTVFARDIFKQTAAALGFPKDPLSIAILAFTRFFSLSPGLLGTLRREILSMHKTPSPFDTKGKAALEAETLAQVIAKDKGAVLSPETLERYARFLMPPGSEDTNEQESGKEKGKEETPGRDTKPREEVPAADELQAMAGEQAEQDESTTMSWWPLLGLLALIGAIIASGG